MHFKDDRARASLNLQCNAKYGGVNAQRGRYIEQVIYRPPQYQLGVYGYIHQEPGYSASSSGIILRQNPNKYTKWLLVNIRLNRVVIEKQFLKNCMP